MTTDDLLALLRRGLLVLLLIGCFGLIPELILLEHYEDSFQFVPFVLLALTLITTVWHWASGSRRSLRYFQAVMLLLIIAAPVGMYFHLRGNYLSEREFDPSVLGLDLWIAVVKGEAPLLAPGAMAQFGLLGLLYAYKHPALDEGADTSKGS